MQASLDIRMMRDGTRWTAVATIRSSGMRAPIDLHASGDVRDLARLSNARTGADVAAASASTRDRVRGTILALCREFFVVHVPNDQMAKMVEACAASCDLVNRARRGDRRAEQEIGKIFIRSSRGDESAGKSASLLMESAGLVDTGRCTFRSGFLPMLSRRRADQRPFLLEGHEPGDEKSPLNKWGFAIGSDRSGHEIMSLRRRLPMHGVGGAEEARLIRKLGIGLHYDPWDYAPYPMDTRGRDLLLTYQPALAQH